MAPSKSVVEESDASMRKRLVESLSQSFPGSALSKALHSMDPSDDPGDDPLSSSCFAELRLEQGVIEEDDEELTSLSWLQDSNLIKSIGGDERLCASPTDDPDTKENGDIKTEGSYSNSHPPNVPYNPQKHINSKPPYSFSCLIFMAIEDSPMKKLPVKDIYNWILTHFPYFQNAPTGWKNSVRHNLSLNKCFKKVEKEKGQQSIGKGSLWCIDPDYRPNLLQALRKTPYHPYHQLQMLATPTPNAGYTILPGTPRPLPLTQRINLNTPSPHLFPFLSKRLAQSKVDSESDIDVANTLVSLKRAADHGRPRPLQCQNGWYRSRSPSPPEFGSERERQLLKKKYRTMYGKRDSCAPIVVYSIPSADHTYSLTRIPHFPGTPTSDVDEEYDFGSDDDCDSFSDSSPDSEFSECDSDGEGRVSPGKRKRRSYGGSSKSGGQTPVLPPPLKRRLIDEDEEKKIVEGADALLNLAGIKTSHVVPLRTITPSSNNNNSKVLGKGSQS